MIGMMSLRCDGCGQLASAEHIARRLQRLEWTTRYRPVHISTLLVGAVAPESNLEFLYAPQGEFSGEAGIILTAARLTANKEASETMLSEFQKQGLLLTYVLDCPLDRRITDAAAMLRLLAARTPVFLARVRRSLRPKRLVPISWRLQPLLSHFREADLACKILLDRDEPFALDGDAPEDAAARLRQALAGSMATA